MGKVITVGIQKGGVSKSTTTGILGYLLSQGNKVLVVDMDSQGNLAQFLCAVDDLSLFRDRTVLQGIKQENVEPFIVRVSENLHIVPADDFLATFPRYVYTDLKGPHRVTALRKALEPVRDQYDYILIDTPPALGDQTINSLAASDYVIVMCETSKFCFNAIPNFLETINEVRKAQEILEIPLLETIGMIRVLVDGRMKSHQEISEKIQQLYGDYVFPTTIKRSAAIQELPMTGFKVDRKLKQAFEPYLEIVQDLVERIKKEKVTL